jgi:hypothetical protein
VTVADLIEALKAMPQDATVVCMDRVDYTDPVPAQGWAWPDGEPGTDGVQSFFIRQDAPGPGDPEWRQAVFL